jgi:Fe-S-cluster containining protein
MTCNGNCCEHFVLPFSYEVIKRRAQHDVGANGTLLEMRMVADMVIPLKKYQPYTNRVAKYFWYTCKHFDTQTRKCKIYDKRPSLCRTYPDGSLDKPNTCKSVLFNGCGMVGGTPQGIAREDFKKAHGLIKDGNNTRLQQLSETPKV